MRKKRRTPLFQKLEIAFSKKDKEFVLSFLMKNNIEFQGYCEAEECSLLVERSERKWLLLHEKEGRYRIIGNRGRLYAAKKHLRPGLLVGGILAACLLFFSGLFVWDVRVIGNDCVDDDTIIEALREIGFGVGSFLPAARLDHIENALLLHCDDIGWVSINLSGTVAYLEVIEKKDMPPSPDKKEGANLVAAYDAVIREVAVTEGRAAVKVGHVVKRGDLLISGVMTGEHENGFTEARGRIYGECRKDFSVTIPKEYTEKRTIFEKTKKITLNFFGYGINIFEDTGNSVGSYDTIYKKNRISFFGLFSLPVSWEETVERSYETERRLYSEEEMVRAAQREINAAITAFLADGELLSRETVGEFTEEGYRLSVSITCIVDITESVPFTVEGE